MQAAKNGRSMEEEAREILRASLSFVESERGGLAESIRKRFAAFPGVELSIPKREQMRKPPSFQRISGAEFSHSIAMQRKLLRRFQHSGKLRESR
jgi:antitoxin FitA